MVRFIRDHQMLVILSALTLVIAVTSVWSSWVEFSHNEQGYPQGHHVFWSWTFFTYCYMQLGWNVVAEYIGIITALVFAAKLREVFEQGK